MIIISSIVNSLSRPIKRQILRVDKKRDSNIYVYEKSTLDMKTQIGKKLRDAEMYAMLTLIKTMLEERC